jgi:hypothetical protein
LVRIYGEVEDPPSVYLDLVPMQTFTKRVPDSVESCNRRYKRDEDPEIQEEHRCDRLFGEDFRCQLKEWKRGTKGMERERAALVAQGVKNNAGDTRRPL